MVKKKFIVFYKYIFDSGDKTDLPRPPAFLDPSLSEDVILENGVNYASGGGGILNETGGYFVSLINIFQQFFLSLDFILVFQIMLKYYHNK